MDVILTITNQFERLPLLSLIDIFILRRPRSHQLTHFVLEHSEHCELNFEIYIHRYGNIVEAAVINLVMHNHRSA